MEKRIYVYWAGEYADETVQKTSVCLWGSGSVPYEAFVIKLLEEHRYQVLYTADDQREYRLLIENGREWDVPKLAIHGIKCSFSISFGFTLI